MDTKYLVIGGGIASAYAMRSIRQVDKSGSLTFVGKENYLPYDRVPLSKGYLLGKVKKDNLFPNKQDFYEQNKISVLTGRSVESIDVNSKSAMLDDGNEIKFEKLLLATGGRPRKLAIKGSELRRIYYLRTIDDCETIREEMSKARKVAIVGGGFIGCELASAFSSSGVNTTIIEAAPSILSLAFDSQTAKWIESYFTEKGVNIITNSVVSEFVGEGGTVTGVRTSNGTTVECDVALVGIGIIPNTELAERAGIKVEKGILTNEFMETSAEDVYAAGDVARFYHPFFGHHLRVEHYDVAVKHGKVAGSNMAGQRVPFTDMPYFFSYMFDLTINSYGDMSRHDLILTRGQLSKKGFFQFFFLDGKIQAFLSLNRPYEEIKIAKNVLQRRASLDELDGIQDESIPLERFAKQ